MQSLQDAQQEFYQNGGAERQLEGDFKAVTPFISTVASPAQQQIQTQVPKSGEGPGVLPAFWTFAKGVASETGHLIGAGASFVGRTLEDMAIAPVHFAESIAEAPADYFQANNYQKQVTAMGSRLDSITQEYKAGNLSASEYKQALGEWSQDNTNLSKELNSFSSEVSKNKSQTIKSAIDLAGDVITIGTLGVASPTVVAGERAATSLLDSAEAFTKGAAAINKLAMDESAWKAVSPVAQNAIKIATQQTLQAAGKGATAAQVGKSVAARLMLTYPLTFNAVAGTGEQIYKELDNNKYGDAIKTAAFNALLLMSGGVIGQALKYGSKALKGVSIAASLRPGGILDELSSRVGNGDRLALGKLAAEKVNSGSEGDVRAMIVGLEGNLKRTGGNIPQAINNIASHLEQYVGWGSLHDMTHEQLWDNMVNYWKHSEGLEKLKRAGLIEGVPSTDSRVVVPGRFTTQDKNLIAEAVTKGDLAGEQTPEQRLQVWQMFKQANPNIAAANNPNVDKQITKLIETIDNPEELHTAINRIPTQIGLKGVPKEYAAQMARDGYVAIIPKSHNLPVSTFEETSGKLATNAAEGDYFVRAAQPVPILKSVGAFLTHIGLSPEMATQRVQEVFKGNFMMNLRSIDLGHLKLVGDTEEQTTQDIMSKLFNYMKAPTIGKIRINGVPLRVPITDMRQLTTRDVMAALGVSRSEARDIQDAIMQAYLQVPTAITGLGDKIVSLNFKYNPAAKPYSRIQSAARFSWNPFFRQGRLPMKAEILAQMQTGGKFPTIAGTNTFMKMFFPGQYEELDSIITNPNFRKIVPGGLGGEAAERYGFDEGVKLNQVNGKEEYPRNALLPAAGLVRSMADREGMDVASFLEQKPEDAQNAIESLLHYDPKNGFMNSPLAKTLNIAFFPFRFNLKVSTYMARFLARQDPVVQYATIKGVMDAHKFLNSPQGMAWYSQNADAIGLFKYFSPLETIATISNALGLKHDSTAQYGELGGLPFGWIPLMLDSVGLTHFGQAYVNPKTGVIMKDYVPTSMYGAVNAALADFMSSLFTYPGASVGLPSKGKAVRQVAGALLPGSTNDFNGVNPPNVTPDEQQFSDAVQQMNSGEPISSGESQSSHMLADFTLTQHPHTPVTIKSPKGTAKKKRDYTPELLPGQDKLFQL